MDEKTTKKRGLVARVRRIGLSLLVMYALYGCAMMALQDRFIFPRDVPGKRAASGPLPRGWEEFTVKGDDGSKVPAWLSVPLRMDGEGRGSRVPLVIYFHGNAEVIDDVAQTEEVRMYRAMGVAACVVEFRGYGRAEGAPSQAAIVADSVKMYDLLAARPEIDKERIVFYGRSLGGGVACAVAKQRPPRAMILQSTFTSVTAMAAKMWLPSFLVRHPFRNDEVVASLDIPILFMHGSNDSIIPCGHSETLAGLARHGRLVHQACDHNDFPSDLGAYRAEIEKFLRDSGVAR